MECRKKTEYKKNIQNKKQRGHIESYFTLYEFLPLFVFFAFSEIYQSKRARVPGPRPQWLGLHTRLPNAVIAKPEDVGLQRTPSLTHQNRAGSRLA